MLPAKTAAKYLIFFISTPTAVFLSFKLERYAAGDEPCLGSFCRHLLVHPARQVAKPSGERVFRHKPLAYFVRHRDDDRRRSGAGFRKRTGRLFYFFVIHAGVKEVGETQRKAVYHDGTSPAWICYSP